MYNTETAEFVGGYQYGYPSDFRYVNERLYKKKTGELFLAGEGGPASKYAYDTGDGYCGGNEIVPLTVDEAKAWAERHLSVSKYISLFGEPEE